MNGHGEAFDPYHKWLGIAPSQQPPHYYRLLGIELFEDDAEVIAAAADRQMAHVRTFQTGPHAQWSQRILNELAAARLCLLDPERKRQYDAKLCERLEAERCGTAPAEVPPPLPPPPAQTGAWPALPGWIRLVPSAIRYLRLECQWRWLQFCRLPPLYWQVGLVRYQMGRHDYRVAPLHPALQDTLPEPGRQPRRRRSLWRALGRLWRAGWEHRRRMMALQNLGRDAFAEEGGACVWPAIADPLERAEARRSQLASELERLNQVPPGHVVSPGRLMRLMLLGAGAAATVVWSWMRPW